MKKDEPFFSGIDLGVNTEKIDMRGVALTPEIIDQAIKAIEEASNRPPHGFKGGDPHLCRPVRRGRVAWCIYCGEPFKRVGDEYIALTPEQRRRWSRRISLPRSSPRRASGSKRRSPPRGAASRRP